MKNYFLLIALAFASQSYAPPLFAAELLGHANETVSPPQPVTSAPDASSDVSSLGPNSAANTNDGTSRIKNSDTFNQLQSAKPPPNKIGGESNPTGTLVNQ